MAKLIYKVLKHDGGWAYEANGTFSEPYKSHDAALAAARRVAKEQSIPNERAEIEYEDAQGKWHRETAEPNDLPDVSVED